MQVKISESFRGSFPYPIQGTMESILPKLSKLARNITCSLLNVTGGQRGPGKAVGIGITAPARSSSADLKPFSLSGDLNTTPALHKNMEVNDLSYLSRKRLFSKILSCRPHFCLWKFPNRDP